MTQIIPMPLVVAMAQPGQSSPNLLLQLMPFLLVVGIFYLLVLLPMRKRQRKVQEFQDSLKVGDRVITTSGIYGQISKLEGKTVQLQIADKVKIEVARTSIGGYQGQEPVVQESGTL